MDLGEPKRSPIRLAWAAGLFDGEGNTFCNDRPDRPSPQVRLQMPQQRPEVLLRFWYSVGMLGRVFGPYSNGKGHKYAWVASGFEHAQAVLAMLWKFLSGPKQEQALEQFRKYHINREVRNGSRQKD